jgi:hypothetical protein
MAGPGSTIAQHGACDADGIVLLESGEVRERCRQAARSCRCPTAGSGSCGRQPLQRRIRGSHVALQVSWTAPAAEILCSGGGDVHAFSRGRRDRQFSRGNRLSRAHHLPGEGTAGPRFAGTPRFEIIDALGAGGMGVVYRAFDRERNTTVALKTLLTVSPQHLLRPKNEFRALADLHHTNLVSLGELPEHDGHWFFTMELIQGTDFLSYVRPPGAGVPDTSGDTVTAEAFRLDTDSAPALTTRVLPATNENAAPSIASGAAFNDSRLRAAFRQLTVGLTALHAAGVVHCDIEPFNVMVTDAGRVVILDFGIAVDTTRAFLGEGGPVGTIAFMAPEQNRSPGRAATGPVGWRWSNATGMIRTSPR